MPRGPLTSTSDGGWILNPRSTFPLTVYGVNKDTAENFKSLLEEMSFSDIESFLGTLVLFICRTKLRCKEIENYLSGFKPMYVKELDKLIKSSAELSSASAEERRELLISLRREAIEALDVRPAGALEFLFEGDPTLMETIESLVGQFGYENLRHYFEYGPELDQVHCVPPGRQQRLGFEELARVGLASRGEAIPAHRILAILKFSEMRKLVADLKPSFRNKPQAFEFLCGLPDLQERLRSVITLQDYFQLKPLPDPVSRMDLGKISATWNYLHEYSTLISETYTKGNDASKGEPEITGTGWEIVPEADACPHCRRQAGKKYLERAPPKVPLHIGCRCLVYERWGGAS